MRASIANISKAAMQYILGFTLYDMVRSSADFEDVRAAMNDRTDRAIELFRSCFTIHLSNGSSFFMLCTLSFLVIAENMRMYYGRLSPAELKEHAKLVGYATFALLFSLLDVGFMVVRITGLVALSRSPALAAGLVLIGMSPSVIFPWLAYPAGLLRQKKHKSGGEEEVECGTQTDGVRNDGS